MPRQASADWNAADRAPEYPPGAGEQVSTNNHPIVHILIPADIRGLQASIGHGSSYSWENMHADGLHERVFARDHVKGSISGLD